MSTARRAQPRKSRVSDAAPRRRWVTKAGTVGLVLLLTGGLLSSYLLLTEPDRLPLRVVEINGEFRYLDRSAIQKVVVDAIDGGFFTVDMNRLRGAVLAMDWVEDVSVRRSWPDRLSMMVSEQVPLARWGDQHLVNRHGRVFTPLVIGPFEGLVHLSGPEGSAERVVGFYQRILDRTRERGLSLREVELDERRHWWLRFDGDLTVSLGRDAVAERLAQFLRVYPTLAAQPARRAQRVDMRYAHGFAVRWHLDDADEKEPPRPVIEDQA